MLSNNSSVDNRRTTMERGGRRHFVNGGGGRGYFHNNNSNSRRDPSNSSNRGSHMGINNDHHINQACHSSQHNFLNPMSSLIFTWRGFVKRQNEIFHEKAKLLNLDEAQSLHPCDKSKDLASTGSCTKQDVLNTKENDKRDAEATQTSAMFCSGSTSKSSSNESSKEFSGRNASQSACRDLKLSTTKSSVDIDKANALEKCEAKERKLEGEMQRFCCDVERQFLELERNHNNMDSFFINRTKYLERELSQRDQTILSLQNYLSQLEERSRIHMEQMQQMNVEFNFQKMQMKYDFENEKAMLFSKAKADTLKQCLPNGMWKDFYNGIGVGNLGIFTNVEQHYGHPQCLQPIPLPTGIGTISDLRDRYEDLKMKTKVKTSDKISSALNMIKNIVHHYEEQGFRVCEESLSNRCVSSLIYTKESTMFPEKDGLFSIGHGETQDEATIDALSRAQNMLQLMDSDELVSEKCCETDTDASSSLDKSALDNGKGTKKSSASTAALIENEVPCNTHVGES